MASIKVKFRQSSVKEKTGSVFYVVTHSKQSVCINTSYKIFSEEWRDKSQSIKAFVREREEYISKIRRYIESDKKILKDILYKLANSPVLYTVEDVEKIFKERIEGNTFFIFMERQMWQLKGEGRLGTAKNYLCAWSSFYKFMKGKDIIFRNITEELIINYETWLKERNVSRNTGSFYMRILRSVYNKAVREGIVESRHPFKKVYTGVSRTRKRAVGEQFITMLQKTDFSGNLSLSYARDLFVFSFYMRGMAFVDMAYLKKSDIREGTVYYVRHKTGKMMKIRLETCMWDIINRYAEVTANSPYVFPIITDTNENKAYRQYRNMLIYYNRLLKKIAELLGLSQSLTSYVARHTWATTARNKNIPLAVISAGMGHSSETITQIYLASLEASVIDEANHAIISELSNNL